MNTYSLIKFIFTFLLLFIFIGCSNEAEYESPTSLHNPTVTGTFIDDVVQGLDYNCSSGTIGKTTVNGNYTCFVGDDVIFSLGSVEIGKIAAQSEFLSPYSLFPNDIDSAVNLARLMQSMDADNNSTNNIIVLDDSLITLLPLDTNFTSPSFIVDVQNSLSITLVSIEEAVTKMNAAILDAGGVIPDGGNIPVADAGNDQEVPYNTTVILDGSGSSDSDSGALLTYTWSVELKPQDSNATISDVTSKFPTFFADLNGTYVFKLIVNDGKMNSAADTVTIIASNSIPIGIFSSFTTNEDVAYSGLLTASDANQNELTYAKVAEPSHGTLSVDSNGSFIYTPTINYNGIDSFTYKVNDSFSDSNVKTVNITIASVDDMPAITNTTVTVNENQTSALTITASDGDNDTLSYSLTGTDASYFDVNSSSGVVTFNLAPDYETKASYSITLNASDSTYTATKNVVINIYNIAEEAILADSSLTTAESSTAGTNIGSITIIYSSDSPITAINLDGNGSTNFDVSTAGVVTIKAGCTLDYESVTSYNLTAIATSASGNSNTVDVLISVTNIAETVPTLIDTNFSILEDVNDTYIFGKISIFDVGDTVISDISLSGVGNSNFSVATDGSISVAVGASIDFETTQTYNLTAIATNGAGNSLSVDVIVHINNVIDEIAILANSSGAIIENAVSGSSAGSVTISYAGDSNITSITLTGTGNENFAVEVNGTITLAANYVLDYETKTYYDLKATAENAAGNSASVDLNISIIDYAFNPQQIAKIKAILPESDDLFGTSVSVSGDYVIVGAAQEDPDGKVSSGSAYLFKKDSNGALSQIAIINASDYQTYDLFGTSVSIDGDYIAIGAYKSYSQGNVYLYKRNSDSNITQIAKISASDAQSDDYFGYSVSMSGDYIAVGAYQEDASGISNAGSAYIFKRNSDSNITQIAKIEATTPSADSGFGYSVSIDGDYIVVGSYKEDSGAVVDAGSAYVFKRNSDVLVSNIADINASDAAAYDYFGNAVSINGDYIAIGAYQEDANGTSNAGSAYIFKRNSDDTVTQTKKIVAGNVESSAYFGYSISIENQYLVVGAHQEDNNSTDSGTAYVYEIDTSDPTVVTQVKQLNASDMQADDFFGNSVSINGNNIAIGAFSEDNISVNSGSTYMFDTEPLGVAP